MADEQEKNQQAANSAPIATESESGERMGDPGRTPGKAEGDEQTVNQSLGQQENG